MTDWTSLTPGQAVTRWAMARAQEALFPGTPRRMADTVTYRFRNGWVDTGDLPCREALRAALPDRHVQMPKGPFEDLVLGLDGAEIDFSRFCHRPTLITRGFRCLIAGQGAARFRVATCGGVRIWVGEASEPIASFEPFDRNTPHSAEITLPLTPEGRPMTLQLEELHERDTTCFFSLTLLEGEGVCTALPKGFEADTVTQMADVLSSLRTDRVFYEDGQTLRLMADVAPRIPLDVRIKDLGQFSRGGLVGDPEAVTSVDVTLTPAQPWADLAEVSTLPAGALSITLDARIGGAKLTRQLGTTILRPGTPLQGDLADRKAQALDLIVCGQGFEPSLALCLAARAAQPERMRRIIEASLQTIEARFDCSDFTILPLLRLWRDHGADLAPDLRTRMRAAFLGYRYWLDEPGNDVMWFWSENHVLCFHTAQLVAGHMFPDDVFPNSGKLGREHAAQALARLHRWFDAIDEDGLCEWNSSAYYPIDLLGLFTIFDMVPELAERARAVLDSVVLMAALHTSGGVPAGSQGRCYEKELLAGPHTELGSIMAIALGGTFQSGFDRAAGLFCVSSYAPPDVAALAAPPKGASLRAAYTQGFQAAGQLSLWKTAHAQLSSVRGTAPGSKGHQAQMVDVQLARHPLARLWINHPGERRPWGERRPSLLAGCHVMPAVAQQGPVALMLFDLARDWTDIPFSQLFAAPEAFGTPRAVGEWLMFADQVAVWCSTPLQVEGAGLYHGALWRAHAERAGWCVALRLAGERVAAFEDRVTSAELRFDAQALTISVAGAGGEVLMLDFDNMLHVNGHPQAFAPLSTAPNIAWNDADLALWKEGFRA